MEVLFTFLKWTSSFSQVDEESGSKMDTHNLSTVITPNILYSNTKTAEMDDSLLAIEAVNTLIEYNEEMCMVSISAIEYTNISRFRRTFNLFSATQLYLMAVRRSQPKRS
jgi:hypothetical protein